MANTVENALVTGGGGFLGKAVVKKLLEKGVSVTSLSRNRYSELDRLEVRQIRGDICDLEPAVLITTLATGMFVAAYPSRWNVHRSADLTAEVGAFYLAGLGVLALGLAMAVRRARYRMGEQVADTGTGARYAPEESGFVWSDDGD